MKIEDAAIYFYLLLLFNAAIDKRCLRELLYDDYMKDEGTLK